MKPVYALRSLFVAGALALAAGAHAQMTGTDIFLKGKYVEIGIHNNGWYGTFSAPPAGYHPYLGGSGTGLGFVADPDMDGWSVGTPPFFGDYFLPGSPFEGWALQLNGSHCSAYNPTFTPGGLTGSGANVSYSTSGSTVTGTWQGMFDSVQMTQVTTLDTNMLYFSINITLTNLAVAPIDNIYYLRAVDPDNEETRALTFNTYNNIDHQSHDTTVVSARGLTYTQAYLAMGTTDTNATAAIFSGWPVPPTTDLGTIYNQTFSPAIYTQNVPDSMDYAIGLVVKIPHLATVDSALDSVYRTTSTYYTRHPANKTSFTIFYSFSPAATDSAIKKFHMLSPITLATKNEPAGSDVHVYPNPSKDIITVTGLVTTDHITLYDMMGRTVQQNWTVNTNGTNVFHYGSIPVGAYLLVVSDGQGTVKSRTPVRKM